MRTALRQVIGTYGIALVHRDIPDFIVGARRGSPLVLGVGKDENFLASDVSAIVAYTRDAVYLNDFDVVAVERDKFEISSVAGEGGKADAAFGAAPAGPGVKSGLTVTSKGGISCGSLVTITAANAIATAAIGARIHGHRQVRRGRPSSRAITRAFSEPSGSPSVRPGCSGAYTVCLLASKSRNGFHTSPPAPCRKTSGGPLPATFTLV